MKGLPSTLHLNVDPGSVEMNLILALVFVVFSGFLPTSLVSGAVTSVRLKVSDGAAPRKP